jgi:hypothetical protein
MRLFDLCTLRNTQTNVSNVPQLMKSNTRRIAANVRYQGTIQLNNNSVEFEARVAAKTGGQAQAEAFPQVASSETSQVCMKHKAD